MMEERSARAPAAWPSLRVSAAPGHGTWTQRSRRTIAQRMVALITFDTPANLPGTPGFDPSLPVSPGFFAGWQTVTHTIRLVDADHHHLGRHQRLLQVQWRVVQERLLDRCRRALRVGRGTVTTNSDRRLHGANGDHGENTELFFFRDLRLLVLPFQTYFYILTCSTFWQLARSNRQRHAQGASRVHRIFLSTFVVHRGSRGSLVALGIGRCATHAQAGSQPGRRRRAQTPAAQAPAATPPAGAQRPGILVAPGGAGGRGVYEAPAADDPANANADLSPKPPVLPLPPAEQARRFWLPPGYRLTPVLADPDIEEPGQIAFDGNGRMFVVELRGYDQTLDGIDLTPPIGRVSVHEDKDNDGVYEHHSAFIDKMVFPRFVTPFGANAVLTMETNTDEVWKYTDTNNDGVADKKELFTTNFGRAGNLEHQQAGLFWAMDNWLYSTVNAFRVRWTPNGVLREPTGPNGAQWGATQDNYGKVWFQGGASGMPGYFQFPVHYGSFAVPGQTEPNLNVIWGAPILIGDIQAGLPGTRLPDGSLILATASGGNDIYRGHRLPADLVGDLLYGEVVGRSVRRLKAVKTEGLTQVRNAYPLSEFIRSLDPLFRPTDVVTAPDGTVYISDMYRGIIEGAPWAKEGTYLRKKVEQYQLHKILGKGRVWRLTYDGMDRDRTQPRMLSETPAQLVAHLSHPNGWWRDTAQQLLVLKQDKSVVPALQQLVRTPSAAGAADGSLFGRFHALWTLEGLGALDAALVREQMKDANPAMRIQAIRASETLYKAGERSLAADYKAATKDADTDVVIQAMLTLNLFKVPDLSRGGPGGAGGEPCARRSGDRPAHPPAGAKPDLRRPWRRPRRRPVPGADRDAAARRDGVQRGVRGVPRAGRPGHADRGPGGRDDGAAARELDTRAGASRLRDQDDSARHDGTDRREAVRRRHGADGHEHRRVDRRRRVVRAQRLRRERLAGHAGGRREGARRHRRAEDGVDARGARGLAAARAGGRRHVEDDREPQRARSRAGRQLPRVDDPRAAAARHVVPGRAAGAADADGDPVHLRDAGRRQRKPARRGDVPPRVRRAGVDRRQDVERAGRERPGKRRHDGDRVPAGAGEVRPADADGNGRERARLVRPGIAAVRGAGAAPEMSPHDRRAGSSDRGRGACLKAARLRGELCV